MKRHTCGKLILTGIAVALGGSAHFGYQQTVLNPMVGVLTNFMNQSLIHHYDYHMTDHSYRILLSFVFGLNLIGAAIGCVLLYFVEKKVGRKSGLLISSTVILVGCPFLISAKSFNSIVNFCIGRLFCGVGAGMATGFQALYLSELGPVHYRGAVSVLTSFAVEIGTNSGNWLGYGRVLGSESSWQYLFILEMVASMFQMTFLLTIASESPTYLHSIDKQDQARSVVEVFNDEPEEVQAAINAIKADVELSQNQIGLTALFRSNTLRRATLLAVLCNAAVAFSGVAALSYFGTLMLGILGLNEDEAALANAVAITSSLIASVSSILLIDRVGRRKLLLVSLVSLATVDSLMMTSALMEQSSPARWHGVLFVFLLSTFMFLFSIGLGPVSWFIGTELAPMNARGSISALAIGVQYALGCVAPVVFLPVQGLIGPASFLIFIVPLLSFALFFYFALPETKDRPIDDVVNGLEMNCHKMVVGVSEYPAISTISSNKIAQTHENYAADDVTSRI